MRDCTGVLTMNEIRIAALNDLQKFIPVAHYLLRPYSLEADSKLAHSILQYPIGLTLRELRAAQALADLTTYEIRSRAIFSIANPVKDSSDSTPPLGMTFDQEREVVARFEVFRRSALEYAKTLDDAQLIELYKAAAPATDTETPAPVVADCPAKPRSNKLDTTLIFEAKVLELIGKFWDDRKTGTTPKKNELCKLVYNEMLRGTIKGKRALTESMVRDAAKPWKSPLVLPVVVPDSKFNPKRHPFKGEK